MQAHIPRKLLRLLPIELISPPALDRDHHMNALATGRFDKRCEAAVLEHRPHLLRRRNHGVEGDIRCRIEIEDQSRRHIRFARFRAPRVQLQHRGLRHGDKTFHGVDGHIGFLAAADVYRRDILLRAGEHMALEEVLAFDAVRGAHHGQRPARDMRQDSRPRRLVIASKIRLGERRRFRRGP